mmetsp:Transcript_54082/g.124511  ORF Transcript_54082/g.124511 Transcript_54082/m.124511 type:complete len:275 (-) Transcript_54082:642-1466(-)
MPAPPKRPHKSPVRARPGEKSKGEAAIAAAPAASLECAPVASDLQGDEVEPLQEELVDGKPPENAAADAAAPSAAPTAAPTAAPVVAPAAAVPAVACASRLPWPMVNRLLLAFLVVLLSILTALVVPGSPMAMRKWPWSTKAPKAKPAYKISEKAFDMESQPPTLRHSASFRGSALVNFMMPDCAHCAELKPNFNKAAQEIKSLMPDELKLAQFDCKKYQNVCEAFSINGYPHLLWFRDGYQIAGYDGERTAEGLVSWAQAKKQAGELLKPLDA